MVVASAYHKGRLRIQWDPQEYNSNESNVQYTEIIDISQEKDFTIEVGWGSQFGWLSVSPPNAGELWEVRTTQNLGNVLRYNGTLTVSVLNTLTAPGASGGDTVEINVFVSAGDDIEVAVPTANAISNFSFAPTSLGPLAASQRVVDSPDAGLKFQSGEESAPVVQEDKDCTDEGSKPMQERILNSMGNVPSAADNAMHVYHGEAITSFRSCLKRYGLVGALPDVGTDASIGVFIGNNFPPIPGNFTDGGWWSTGTSNLVVTNLFNYLYPAYLGIRGGVRWKIVQFGARGGGRDSIHGISLQPNASSLGRQASVELPATSTLELFNNAFRLESALSTWQGAQLLPAHLNPAIEVEIPYQTQRRFRTARTVLDFPTTSDRPWQYMSHGPNTNGNTKVFAFCAAGEDYSNVFFIGSPVVWLTTPVPDPAV
jgi:hypothetical protein